MPVVQNQVFLESPALYRIFKIAREGQMGLALPSFDGSQIVEPLEIGRVATVSGSHGAYACDDTWSADGVCNGAQAITGAAYDWKRYHTTLKIDNITSEVNKGKSRIFDILAIRMRNAVKILREDLATDFYDANYGAGVNMVGLRAITSTVGTIGGIARAGHAWWEGHLNTVAGDPDYTMLNKGFYQTKHYGSHDRATVILTTDGVLQKYEDLISTVKLGAAGTASALRIIADAKGPKVLDGGFDSFTFKRIPIISDKFCPAETLFFVNENYIHWRILKNFDSTGWKQLETQGRDWAQMTIKGYGALTCSSPRKFARFTGVTEA